MEKIAVFFGGFTSEKTTSDICKEVEKFGLVWLGGGKASSDGWPLILLLRRRAAPGDGKDPKVCMAQQSKEQGAKLPNCFCSQVGGRRFTQMIKKSFTQDSILVFTT